MTNEEKQALIEYCKEEARLKREHITRLEKHMPGQFNLTKYQIELQVAEIALAVLTEQPVAWLVEFHEAMTDDYCREVKTVQLEKPTGHYMACATPLIRAAGYEVQE